MQEISAGIIPLYKKSKNNLFLIIKQHNGHWGFPKGHLESNEDLQTAARREVEEEVGIKEITIESNLSHTVTYPIEKDGYIVNKSVTYFLGVVGNNIVSIQEEEILDYAWLPYQEAYDKVTYEESKKAISVLFQKFCLLYS